MVAESRPIPPTEVDIYDPGTNSWSTGFPFVNARRNFPADTDGMTRIWLAGGYEPSTPAADMEIFSHCPQASPTPTPTATATASDSNGDTDGYAYCDPGTTDSDTTAASHAVPSADAMRVVQE